MSKKIINLTLLILSLALAIKILAYFGLVKVNKDYMNPNIKQIPLELQEYISPEHKDELYLIHFFSTWCAFCHKEMGFISELAKDTPMYAFLYKDNISRTIPWEEQYNKVFFKVIQDQEIIKLFNIKRVPQTILVYKNQIVEHIDHSLTEDKIVEFEGLKHKIADYRKMITTHGTK